MFYCLKEKFQFFLRKNKITFLKQNYEKINKKINCKANRFINFYKLNSFFYKKQMKKTSIKKINTVKIFFE